MTPRFIKVFFLLFFCQLARAQTNNVFTRRNVNSLNSVELKSNIAAVTSAQLLTLDEARGIAIYNTSGDLSLQIPMQKDFIEIDLEPASILSPNFKVLSSKGEEVEVDLPHFYHGKIKGETKSFVAISITEDAIEGMIVSDKLNLTIGRLKNTKEKTHVVYATNDIENKTPICSDAVAVEYEDQLPTLPKNQTNADGCGAVEIYLEADYQMYSDWGGNVQTVVTTLTSIFNNVSLLYDNEGINLVISTLFVWETPDPYTSATSTSQSLNLLDNYWDGQGNNFDGDIVHLVTSKPLGGGIAYYISGSSVFNGMTQRAVFASCNKGSAKGLSAGISNNVQNIPTYSWNVEVIAHEIGHNFGLPHTQNCTWTDGSTTGALDDCYAVEGGSCNPGPTPTNGGTIMSYCHLSSTGINFNNGFGPLPSGKMNAEFDAATCLSGSKVARPQAENKAFCNNQSVQLTATGCTGAYEWFDAPAAGNSLSTTDSYTTPLLTQNTSYYVNCTVGGCSSRRRQVDVEIFNQDSVPTVQNVSICGSESSAILTADCYGANINWYDANTAGNLLGSGNNFELTNITSSITVYAECSVTACPPSDRAALTINYGLCPFCEPTGLFCDDDDMITQVKISQGSVDLYENNSTCESGAYTLYTPNTSIDLVLDTTYTITTSNPGLWADGLTIWIDYNKNNIFEAREKIEDYYTGGTWTTRQTSFTIPSNSTPGPNRIRVKLIFGSSSNEPCSIEDGSGYGEIEDYIINILEPVNPCPDALVHLEVAIEAGSYFAGQTISSKADVSTQTTYQAGNYILLEDGFQAGTNETFEAKIGGCPE